MNVLKRFWHFLKQDSWQSWTVSLILTFIFIKFVFFPVLSLALATPLPLVVVESCSMYHEAGFDEWWERNSLWYTNNGITKAEFSSFKLKNGLNKGDVVIVSGRGSYRHGDIIIFRANFTYPLIHRIIKDEPLSTKGDHNGGQLDAEIDIDKDEVLGKAVARVPGLGWLKLVFFEGLKDREQRGFCR